MYIVGSNTVLNARQSTRFQYCFRPSFVPITGTCVRSISFIWGWRSLVLSWLLNTYVSARAIPEELLSLIQELSYQTSDSVFFFFFFALMSSSCISSSMLLFVVLLCASLLASSSQPQPQGHFTIVEVEVTRRR